MSSTKAIRCDYIDTTGALESEGIWAQSVVLHPGDSAVGVAVFADYAEFSGTFTRVGTVATVVTAAPHGLEVTDNVYVEWSLTDGLQRVASVVNATTFTVTVTDTGASDGDITYRQAQMIFQMPDVLDTVQVTVPGEGLPMSGLYVYLPTGSSASVFYRKAQ